MIEAKRSSINPAEAAAQALHYAQLADVPFIFLANGREIRFWDWEREAHPHPVRTFFAQEDLERRAASRQLRVDPLTKPIDRRIAGRDYSVANYDLYMIQAKLIFIFLDFGHFLKIKDLQNHPINW